MKCEELLKKKKRSYHSNDYHEKHWTTKFTSNDDDLQLKKGKSLLHNCICFFTRAINSTHKFS